MSSQRNKLKRNLRRSLADFGVDSVTSPVTSPIRSSRASITAAKSLFPTTQSFAAPKPATGTTGTSTSVSAYTPTAYKPPVITAVVAPSTPKPIVAVAPLPAPVPKTVDRGVYAPTPYEVPSAAYIPPSAQEPEPEVTWQPPSARVATAALIKGTEALPPPPAAPAPKKLGIIARILAFFGLVKASEAKISGDTPMSRFEAAGSLVRRARQGDQNAMAIIDMARQNAAQGNVQARLAVGCIKKYIEANPVGPTSFAGEDRRGVSHRLRLLARRDIPISVIDPMLGWELGE